MPPPVDFSAPEEELPASVNAPAAPTIPQDLVLFCPLCPGDTVLMTAVVRDLHRAHPGRFRTAVRTGTMELWQHNPYITPEPELVNPRQIFWMWSSTGAGYHPRHLIDIWSQSLASKLRVRIPLTQIKGDIYLTDAEKSEIPPPLQGEKGPFWIVMAGGKRDTETKWWPTENYQAVVSHFAGKIKFIQCGLLARTHHHKPLAGVINCVGKTTPRQLVQLIYHADGVLAPITFATHLAAAIPTRPGKPNLRAAVVIGGGREPAHIYQYPGHQVLHTVGALPCSADGPCWKSHLLPRKGSDATNCLRPVQTEAGPFAQCMTLITPARAIAAIESYYQGGALSYL